MGIMFYDGPIGIFDVGFALVLPRVYGLDGVLCSMSVLDVLTFTISVIVIVLTYRQLNSMNEKSGMLCILLKENLDGFCNKV